MSDNEKTKPTTAADIRGKKLADLKFSELTLGQILDIGAVITDPIGGNEAPSDSDLTGRAKELYDRAYSLETQLNTADENGVFVHQDVKHEPILGKIKKVYATSLDTVSAEKYSDAIGQLDEAQDLLDQALQKIGLRRRLTYVYGLPAALYLLAVLGVIVWLAFHPPSLLTGSSTIISIPLEIMGAGVVGGVLRGVKALWSQVDKLQYRKFWGTWFLLCPIMGALLGGLVFLLFDAGILVSTTTTTTITNPTLPIFLAIFAGYNWEWAEGVLANVPSIFSVGSTDNKNKTIKKKTNGKAPSGEKSPASEEV